MLPWGVATAIALMFGAVIWVLGYGVQAALGETSTWALVPAAVMFALIMWANWILRGVE